MRGPTSNLATILFAILLICLIVPPACAQDSGSGQAVETQTALDRYVAAADDSYAWKLAKTIAGDGYTGYVIDLTSQSWRTEADVDRTLWKHWLTIIKPDAVKANTALLYITHGKNGDDPPAEVDSRSLKMAMETGTVVADLRMVPNQTLRFADSRRHDRQEDDLIAYSRVKYMITGDETWLVRLPMVKSGVRAMDAIGEFMATTEGGEIKVDQFVIAGASKRGWTTWLVGLVDKRVIGMMPLVIDALNTEAVTRHHYEAYGFFSPSLGDYVRHGLYPHKLGSPEFAAVLKIEDPYMYRHRERMKIPKYVINASGDQYFLPDNSQYYFLDLPDEKLLRYVPNTKHNLAGSDARESMIAFYDSLIHQRKRPDYSWTIRDDGSIEAETNSQPIQVNLWQATNKDARDFRLDTIGAAWTSTPIAAGGQGKWVGKVEQPAEGFTAFMIEFVFDSGGKYPLKATTDIKVIPDLLPFQGEKMMPYLGKRP